MSHPSNPNYYAVLGGSDFGKTHGSLGNQPNLVDLIEAAGKTWAGYKLPNTGTIVDGVYNSDQTPFLSFSDITDNPARLANLHVLSDMTTALE